MLLSKTRIEALGLIENAVEKQYRSAGYDITVGTIIDPSGQELADGYVLPPRGIVEVVSRERIHLPAGIGGYAFIKTGLCNSGVLALNMGIVDPGYDGLLSTTLVNFGKSCHLVTHGSSFLRLTFHEIAEPLTTAVAPNKDNESYIQERKSDALKNFGSEFLNVQDIAKASADEASDHLGKAMVLRLPIILGLWTIAISFVIIILSQVVSKTGIAGWTNDVVREVVVKKLEAVESENRALKAQIERLEGEYLKLRTQRVKPTN